MTEILLYEIVEGVCLLLGFTLIAYNWGQLNLNLNTGQMRYRLENPDKSKLITFLCIGLAWLCKLASRMIWDYVNVSYVAYVDNKS